MTVGPGRYDDEVTWVRERTHATGVVLIVVGGDKGAGFAVQATAEATLDLPAVLRTMADQIEADTMTTAMTDFKAWLKPDD
jgi:hypothetical protein